jgi:hypothetical protein
MITDYWHVCYDIIDQIYDNYYAYLACRRHEEHALLISSPPFQLMTLLLPFSC